MKAWFSVVAIVCAMAIAPAAVGTQGTPAPTKPGATATPQDKAAKPTLNADSTFMKTAAMDGMAEVGTASWPPRTPRLAK
jgi:hypothetical protein